MLFLYSTLILHESETFICKAIINFYAKCGLEYFMIIFQEKQIAILL